jgi:16S rRNA G966 N2-methylase RsmD
MSRVKGLYLRAVPLESNSVEQSLLNIENKQRSNLFPWTGQFSPQLVEVLLRKYASSRSAVLDPFAGSGTVLCECGRRGLRAYAVEINPAAYSMARTYQLMNRRHEERRRTISNVSDALRGILSAPLPLFVRGPGREEAPLQDILTKALSLLDDPESIALLETLIVLSDFYKPGLDCRRVLTVWNKLVSIVRYLPYSEAPLTAVNADARQLPLDPQSIDLVITSPPYINVFNYHQQFRASAEALGWNLLSVARSEIGSNRKNRGNRFLTVIQYCLDITAALLELSRVCNESARIIFVVGRESRVRGTPLLNGDIVALVATKCVGLRLRERQERVFRNKFGAMIFEDILHFTGVSQAESPLVDPRLIGKLVLERALKVAATAAAVDIRKAIERAGEVRPSPIYDPKAARREHLEQLDYATTPR